MADDKGEYTDYFGLAELEKLDKLETIRAEAM